MNKELYQFTEKIRNAQNFKREEYNTLKYKGEIADIQKKIKEKNTKGILDIWKQKIDHKQFELEHPLFTHINSRAVYNITTGSLNFVFMIDKENKYPWIFTQITCIIDFIITPDTIINIAYPWKNLFGLEALKSINPKNLLYSEKNFGFTLSMIIPQHFSCFIYQFFHQMDKYNIIPHDFPIEAQRCFFLPQKYLSNIRQTENTTSLIYLHPMGIANQHTRESEKFIYHESIKTSKISQDSVKFDLIVWLGLSAARTWIEEDEGVKNIFLHLSKYFKKIKIYFNGITSYDHIIPNNKQNLGSYSSRHKQFEKIKNKIQEINTDDFYCEIISLDLKDYKTKISYCDTVDICISEGNTTGMIPFQFCHKPGVNFLTPFTGGELVGTLIDRKYVIKSSLNDNSYHMSWEIIFNTLVNILYDVKKVKIPYVDINEQYVKTLKKQYELQINKINQNIPQINIAFNPNSAKAHIYNHLSYKLGQALIENSKSILGYIRMPYVLSYIKDKHKFEQKAYEEKIKENPNLALPPLETYLDYNEALKEKECFTYKLGEAFIRASKNWYKGGYIKFILRDVPRLKKIYSKY